jgi:hypothetical protein
MSQNYEYKCVPAPMEIVVNSAKDSENAVKEFAMLINQDATDGWEFYSMETVAVSTKPGCGSTGKEGPIHFNMLVFRRLK